MKKFIKGRRALIIYCYCLIALLYAVLIYTTTIEHKFIGDEGIRYFETQVIEDGGVGPFETDVINDEFIYTTCTKTFFGFECVETERKVEGIVYEDGILIQEYFEDNKLAYDSPTSFGLLMAFAILGSVIFSFTTSCIEAVELKGKIYHVDRKRETRFHNEFTYIGISLLCLIPFIYLINTIFTLIAITLELILITYFVRRKELL